jgi:hypothetical protein
VKTDDVDAALLDVDPPMEDELVIMLDIVDEGGVEDTTAALELVVTAIELLGLLELIVLDSTAADVVEEAVTGLSVMEG